MNFLAFSSLFLASGAEIGLGISLGVAEIGRAHV